ncbi:hypothetical protein B0H21DRAFT_341109 [Amylocystis lapponica]|nr:hypothetical protein B0H21DRAFT_341109 [Amylocystis lapponica]
MRCSTANPLCGRSSINCHFCMAQTKASGPCLNVYYPPYLSAIPGHIFRRIYPIKGPLPPEWPFPALPKSPIGPPSLRPSHSLTRFPYISRRRSWATVALLLIMSSASLVVLGNSLRRGGIATVVRTSNKPPLSSPPGPLPDAPAVALFNPKTKHQELVPHHLRAENYLAGPPTAHMRDSLRNDTRYLTSWLAAGWTNDVITIGNLIYLAMITDRVPILPPFTSHINAAADPAAFSDIFDVPRLIRSLNIPVLEWHQVKDVDLAWSSGETDELGCWNIWEVDDIRSDGPRQSYSTQVLKLDISYTRAPSWVKLIPGYEHDMHSTFWSLAKLAFPEARTEALANPAEHPTLPTAQTGVALPPDEQLLCYDFLYYLCGQDSLEFERDYSPSWRFVMRHFRWTATLEELAHGYLRRMMGIAEGEPIPPYITVHARRGDFADWCRGVPRDQCFAPLSAFRRRVLEIQRELRVRHGIEAKHVIMTSDEKDPAWWKPVADLGWLRVDYEAERTAELHGNWYPVIVDAVIQSGGMGFVGTDQSTFSTLARRRVTDWNKGAVRTVKWGRPDSDAH